jgi:outer membrane receptor protein involved in Fe transport
VIRDMALFVSNEDPYSSNSVVYGNIYQPIYDTVNIAYAKAQISYQKEEKWNLLWTLIYSNYETKNEVKAWNLPELRSSLAVRYDLQNKIVAKGSITFMGGRYTKSQNIGEVEELAPLVYGRKLNPVFDFNLGAEYRFTKQISAFIDINNIISQNYEIWGNYPVQGINVMGGLTFSFWEN